MKYFLFGLLIYFTLFIAPGLTQDRCFKDCAVDDTGYGLIKKFEGYSPFVYNDAVGIPTIGFGHVILPGEDIDTPLMGPDALNLLKMDVSRRTGQLNSIIRVSLAYKQFDALASFGYNVGIGRLKTSTLLKKVNSGQHAAVHYQFLRYDKAGDKVLLGLKIRRESEANLYDSAIGNEP